MSDLVCLNCGAEQTGSTVISISEKKPYCPRCRCRQFVTPEAFEESWEKFDRHIGYRCTFQADTEVPTVHLFKKRDEA